MSPPAASSATRLSPLALLGLTYAYISSGPYGIEPAVGAGGALLSIVGLVVFAACWALPQALLAAELTAAMPEQGSVVMWLERGVGRRWAAVGAGCLVLSQVFDLAIFTGQVVGYAAELYPALRAGSAAAVATQVGLCVAVAAANLAGLGVVTRVLVGSLLVTVSPFLLAPFVALARGAHFDAAAAVARPPQTASSLAALGSVLLWTYQGFFNVSNVAGSIDDAQRAYPRVLVGVTLLLVVTYACPIAYGVMLLPDAGAWGVGAFSDVGRAAAPWVGQWVLVGACVANTMGGLSGMALYSTLLARVAERRLLPLGALGRALARSSSRGVPHFSVLFFAATTLGLQYLDFTYIVAADTMLNLAGFSVIAIAYLRLRVLEPDLARPFRVPGGELGARIVGCACLVFAAAMSVIIAIGEWYAVAAALVSAALIYVAAGFAEEADDKRDDAPSAEEDDRLPLIDE
jgi:amino acid transporter